MTGCRGFDYNRVRVLLKGLEQVAPDQFEVFEFQKRTQAVATELRRKAEEFDLVYVPPFRRLDVGFVKKNTGGLPVIFDPLIGSTITRVEDYGYWWRRPYAKWIDRRDYGRADHVLFDTEAHRQWSIKTLGLSAKHTSVLYIGADTSDSRTPDLTSEIHDCVTVGFYGSLAPLQGVETILKAAVLLQNRTDIIVEIIGNVNQDKSLREALRSAENAAIRYVNYLPYDELQRRIHKFDICLGIFGKSIKADIVIPNKIYHYAAHGKPIITRDTLGMREHFEPGVHFHPSGTSAESLAEVISSVKDNLGAAKVLGMNMKLKIQNELNERRIANDFLSICDQVVAAM